MSCGDSLGLVYKKGMLPEYLVVFTSMKSLEEMDL